VIDGVPTFDDLVALGRHISYTERRSEDAERELRQVKLLTLLKNHIGEDFIGVVTGIANFGIFVQLKAYLIDGLIRYEDLMDDYWQVEEKSGQVCGRRSGITIRIGDVVQARIAKVDLARRELNLTISDFLKRTRRPDATQNGQPQPPQKSKHAKAKEKVKRNRQVHRVEKQQRRRQRRRRH
jgi:ribonuclease R